MISVATELKTERLILRSPQISDVSRLFELMSDVRLTRFLSWEPHNSQETTESLVKTLIEAQTNDKGYHWCVLSNNIVIGLVSLIDVRRKIRTWTINRAELSYWISPDFQGKGYATEASKAVVDFGLRNLSLHKVVVAHVEENIESKKICKKIGFVEYAREHDAFSKNSKWHDLIWYERINEYEKK